MMSDLHSTYIALSSTSPRNQVSNVLKRIVDGSLQDSFDRAGLIQAVLDDVKSCKETGVPGRLTSNEAAQALSAVKALGRNPSGSEILATPANLSTLMVTYTSFTTDPAASIEALKCVANTLLLVEHARAILVQEGNAKLCVDLLEKCSSPDEIFVLSRILYLCTVSPALAGSFIRDLVEGNNMANSRGILAIVESKLDLLTAKILQGTKMSREAMTDVLKLTFNLLLHYPNVTANELREPVSDIPSEGEKTVMGDFWSPKLDPFLSPLLRVFISLPPTAPCPIQAPMKHVIHNLMVIPASPRLHPQWFGSSPPQTDVRSPESGSETSQQPPTGPPGIVVGAYKLLDTCLNYYLPGNIEADDPSVLELCKKDGDTLDGLLCPLTVLIARLCIGDKDCRLRMREWLVPPDLDRTQPLELRSDLLGRTLRLLASLHHPGLKDSVGSMLFVMFDSDPVLLSTHVGYGNVAGFLFHRGLLNALPSSSLAPLVTPSGDVINPISGVVQGAHADLEMTEEEKEEEAEKLCTLFERLEQTGIGQIKIQ